MAKLKKRYIYESTEGLRIISEGVINPQSQITEAQSVSKVDTVMPKFSITEHED